MGGGWGGFGCWGVDLAGHVAHDFMLARLTVGLVSPSIEADKLILPSEFDATAVV